MAHRIAFRGILTVVAAVVGAGSASAGEPVKLDEVQADKGFIDDPIAFSDDGATLAYLLTDGATFSELRFVTIGAKDHRASVPYPSITPERMDFLDGERVLIVERNPDTRLARAQVFTRKGPTREKLGPASDIVLATVGGVKVVVTYLRTPRGKAAGHTLTAYRASDLKPVGHKVLNEDPEGRVTVAGVALKVLFFEEGYAAMIGRKEGEFDAAHDIRKPSLEAEVDVFSGKIVAEREIKDLVKWAELSKLRANHQNESDFVQFSEDGKQLLLVDRDDVTSVLTTPRPLGKYDNTTLRYQPTGDHQLTLALTVDPVNPEAVAAKKADKDWIDLYRLDVKAHALTEIARLDGKKRPSKWRIAGSRIALLHGHRGFGRGGSEMEIFELGGPAPATPPTKK